MDTQVKRRRTKNKQKEEAMCMYDSSSCGKLWEAQVIKCVHVEAKGILQYRTQRLEKESQDESGAALKWV